MIKSMTGFGKVVLELTDKKLTIEIKTLNSKQLDINTRIPNPYKEKEPEIRSLLSRKLGRGKIEFNIYIENTEVSINYSFNKSMAKKYYEELKALSTEINQENFSNYLPLIVKMPDVLYPEKEEFNENDWAKIKKSINDTLDQVNEFRIDEGKLLENDFIKRIKYIKQLLLDVNSFEEKRITNFKERINKNLNEISDKVIIDRNRFEQEIIYYIEKLDITEEKVRLEKHCDYFLETLNAEISSGKKLNFISQEIGREINTLGSKANDVDIQKIVVQMKDELEKIKEQLLNIL